MLIVIICLIYQCVTLAVIFKYQKASYELLKLNLLRNDFKTERKVEHV